MDKRPRAKRWAYAIACSIATSHLFAGIAAAKDVFPSRLVKIILPFPAGSTLDSLTRVVGEGLGQKWDKGVIIENISGGGGNTGADRFSRADLDGYTLLATPPGPITINKLLYKDVNYDAMKFVPISLMAKVPNVLVVRNGLETKTLKDFIALAKRTPGKLNYASQGAGSTGYLTARLLEAKAGIDTVHVPYRGAAPILTDIAAGHVDFFFDTIVTSLPLHQAGTARILAVADTERSSALPDVPSVSEVLPGFRSISWFGLLAPPGTPAPLAAKISKDVAEVIKSPAINKRLLEMMLVPVGSTPEEAASFFAEETVMWSKLIKDLAIEPM
jgi:tripartite-type tricarboxylate transporter receptor subunit TctC